MPMTPEQVANAVLRERQGRGRGTVFQTEELARRWLHNTPWFRKQYPTPFKQTTFVVEVASIMRSKKAKKGANTRAKNKARMLKEGEKEALAAEIAKDKERQQGFDF